MATIVIYTSGTLGDHLPFIALGRALKAKGHRVRLAINQSMHAYAGRSGLEAIALTDIDRGPEHARANAWAWDFWNTPDQNLHPSAGPADMGNFLTQARELIDLCRDADLLISTSIRMLGYVAYHALKLPWLTVSMNPYSFWQPGTAKEWEAKQRALHREYVSLKPVLVHVFNELGIGTTIPAWSDGWLFSKHVILASSPHFSRPDLNQFQPHSSIDLTGFWLYDDPAWKDWQPDETLRRFCQNRPMVLSFSSQPLENPRQALEVHVKAAARLQRPLIIQRGWAGFSEADLPPGTDPGLVLFAGFLPHDWLFARASCTIQHGGIGSIANALRQGCPMLIEPYGNDQVYNASRVAGNLKAGAAMHPFKMTVDSLVQVLETKVLTPEFRGRAQALGAKIKAENGLDNACQLIEAFLAREQNARPGSAGYIPYTRPLRALVRHHGAPEIPGSDILAPGIPPILHQTWDESLAPLDRVRFQRTWQAHNPDWACCFWTDADSRRFLAEQYPWFLRIYDSYPDLRMKAYAVRYFLLYHFGGVHVDLDVECAKPIHPLLEGREIVLGVESQALMHRLFPVIQPFESLLCNGFMASRARHPFWEHVFKKLIAFRQAPDPLDAAGSCFLTRAHGSFPEKGTISILSQNLIYSVRAVDGQTLSHVDPVERSRITKRAYGIRHGYFKPLQGGGTPLAERMTVSILDAGEQVETPPLLPLQEYRRHMGLELGLPRVSCLMVATGPMDLVQPSIHCFQRQTYPDKELILVDISGNDALAQWVQGLPDDRIICLRQQPATGTREALMAMAAKRATGIWIACWNQADLSEPHRLEIQMAAIHAWKAEYCFLERKQIWRPGKHQLFVSARRPWKQTLVCRKSEFSVHAAMDQTPDKDVLSSMAEKGRAALVDCPQLYTTLVGSESGDDADAWDETWQEGTGFFNPEVYEVLVQNIQNDLGLDLSPWTGRKPAAPILSNASVSPEPEPETRQTIPKILHQTWKDEDLPPDLETFRRTWQNHHSDWTHCLWTDSDIREFLRTHYAWFLPIYDRYPEHIMRVDAVRYFILFHYGGVYADLDFECLRPVDPLLDHGQVVLGLEPRAHQEMHFPDKKGLKHSICNAFMASVPGHPFWEHVFKQLVASHRAPGPLDATGPFFLTRAHESYGAKDTITLVSPDQLYPISSQKPWSGIDPAVRAEIAKQAYAVHHWRGTWWKAASAKQENQARASLYVYGKRVTDSLLSLEQARTWFSQKALCPLVSCLMVTKNRYLLARRAIQCFQKQRYENRELIIIDDGDDDTLEKWTQSMGDSRIFHVRLPAENKTLGELRNLAVDRATGTHVTQWDDDDLSDPDRLSVQLYVMDILKTDACFLERHQIWWPETRRFAISCRRIWEGSFVCARHLLPRYPAQARGEDTPVAAQVAGTCRIALLDLPDLYTYVFHGANTFDSAHWESHWLAATESLEGDACDIKLREIMQHLEIDLLALPDKSGVLAPAKAPQSSRTPETPGASRRTTVPQETDFPTILILVPVKDAVQFLPNLWENLEALAYPHDRISMAFLESDSADGTHEFIQSHMAQLQKAFAGVRLFKRDYGFRLYQPRWEKSQQLRRRSIMARSRNYLLSRALEDETWVLWIDADVAGWPRDIIEQLLAAKKDIAVPNCVSLDTGETFDLNTFKLKSGADLPDWSPHVSDGVVQPPKGLGRLYLSDLRQHDCVEVDGVGGTMLLIRADLHREGLIFPPFGYKGHIETEGLAVMARDMGYQSWGLPNVIIVHP
ncbi:MAG: glycosyltransferase [Pseudomonadota bacterium]